MICLQQKCLALFVLFLSFRNLYGQEISEGLDALIVPRDVPERTSTNFIFSKDRQPSNVTKRIIGGNVTIQNQFPFQVALLVDTLYFCGGTLISTEWVLTAAHCVDGASVVTVILGAHNIFVSAEIGRVQLDSKKFIMHQNWNKTALLNDIALVRLPRNVTLNKYINTVEFTKDSNSYSGFMGRCIGWGKTLLDSLSSVLRYVDLEIIPNQSCSSLQEYKSYIKDSHICTSGRGIVGSCNGDSGGPLIYNNIQIGIVSFGYINCKASFPSVFTRVSEYADWITYVMQTGEAPNGAHRGTCFISLLGVLVNSVILVVIK